VELQETELQHNVASDPAPGFIFNIGGLSKMELGKNYAAPEQWYFQQQKTCMLFLRLKAKIFPI
jgi:hypothetical protein